MENTKYPSINEDIVKQWWDSLLPSQQWLLKERWRTDNINNIYKFEFKKII